MNIKNFSLFVFLLWFSLLVGLSHSQTPAPAKPVPPEFSDATAKALLLLQHKIDDTEKQIYDLNAQLQALQMKAKDHYAELAATEETQKKDLADQENKALKALGLDVTKWSVDHDTMTPKEITPPPPSPTPAPAAKK